MAGAVALQPLAADDGRRRILAQSPASGACALLPLPCMAIAGALCLAYLVTAPTRYAATMSIFIDPRERPQPGLDAQPMPQNPDIALVESEMRILVSKAVLRKLVETQNLLNRSRLSAERPAADDVSRA